MEHLKSMKDNEKIAWPSMVRDISLHAIIHILYVVMNMVIRLRGPLNFVINAILTL